MAATAWPQDPRRQRQVGRLRLRLPQAGLPGAAGAGSAPGEPAGGAATWRSRVEDALRCADLATGQRLVMLRRVQVKAGSAAAPGWSAVVEAACRDAARQARHGADPAAARADAVWFADWDEAMGTWLQTTLQGGNAAAAWFWPRVARLAGWRGVEDTAQGGGHAPAAHAPPGVATARALLALWQSDPASQRAATHWLERHPEAARLLAQHAGAAGGTAGGGCHPMAPDAPAPGAPASHSAAAKSPPGEHPRPPAPWQPRASDGAGPVAVATEAAAAAGAPGADGVTPTGLGAAGDQGAATCEGTARPAAAHQTHQGGPQALGTGLTFMQSGAASSPQEAPSPTGRAGPGGHPGATMAAPPASTVSLSAPATPPALPPGPGTGASPPAAASDPLSAGLAASSEHDLAAAAAAADAGPTGWHLRATRLGGLPLCLNAWERLHWVAALEAWCTAHAPGPGTAEIGLRALAASSPWLAAWSRLPSQFRQALLQDPAAAALPVADLLPSAGPARQEALLLDHWRAAPASLRALGRQGWCRLNASCRRAGWRGLRTLLWRPAWVQLSATHLDLVSSLQQVDLGVRRLGLDCDPGWLPWFGRIVQLHYEPPEHLPAWAPGPSAARATDGAGESPPPTAR